MSDSIIYQIAEKFKSIQGEGVYAGTPMAFIRFVGCSVGKRICAACDTVFERMLPWHGGGEFSAEALLEWVGWEFDHVCLTGGEPLDQELGPLLKALGARGKTVHVETSGTRDLATFRALAEASGYAKYSNRLHVCVSPKPGFLPDFVDQANEIKVIVPGLGVGEGWPTLENAVEWSGVYSRHHSEYIPVFLQPKNNKDTVDPANLALCQELVLQYPKLRLSVQMHKLLRVR